MPSSVAVKSLAVNVKTGSPSLFVTRAGMRTTVVLPLLDFAADGVEDGVYWDFDGGFEGVDLWSMI